MKNDNLFKRDKNQITNQLSNAMQESRIVVFNFTKNEFTPKNLSSTQSTNFGAPFFVAHLSGAYSGYTNTIRF